MNLNLIGGVLSVAALVAIIVFHDGSSVPTSTSTSTPTAIPSTPTVAVPATEPKVTTVKPAPKAKDQKTTVYHRVEQGGKQGSEVGCANVKNFAEGKSQAEVALAAKQYNASIDEVKRWYVCIN